MKFRIISAIALITALGLIWAVNADKTDTPQAVEAQQESQPSGFSGLGK